MAKVVKPAGGSARQRQQDTQTTMHGSTGERRLMSGTGALIKWSGTRVKVTGEKPRGRRG